MHYDFLYHVWTQHKTDLCSLKNLGTPRSWRRLQRVVCYKPAHQISLPKQTSSGPPSVLRLIHLQVIRMVSFRSAWLSPWSVPSWAGAWVSGADVWDKLSARNAALPDHDASTMASATCTTKMNASDILQVETHSWDCNSGSMPKNDKWLKHLELNGCNDDLHCRHWPSKWLSSFFHLAKSLVFFFASTKSAKTKQVYSWTDRRQTAQAISFPVYQFWDCNASARSVYSLKRANNFKWMRTKMLFTLHSALWRAVSSPKRARRCHGIHKYFGMLPWNADSEGRTLEPRLRTSDQQHAQAGAFNLTLHPLSLSILSSHIGVHLIERILRI